MVWRSLQRENFCSCVLWSSSLCSSLCSGTDTSAVGTEGFRWQVEVCDHRKHWNALHLFLNWKLTWTTILYLPATCSKGSFFFFFFLTLKKLENIMCISSFPGMCFLPHVPFSVWAELQAWFWVFWHPDSDGKHISKLGSLPNIVTFL